MPEPLATLAALPGCLEKSSAPLEWSISEGGRGRGREGAEEMWLISEY